jgi:ubiquinone/menaquinone biosynthesis C-methylase UbiE
LESEFYDFDYEKISYSGFNRILSNVTHALLEKNLKKSSFKNVLELGVTKFQHQPFVKHDHNFYVGVDISKNLIEFNRSKNFVVANAQKLPFLDQSFDRILMMCFLHHVDNLDLLFDEMIRTIKKNGQSNISIFLPSDPALLYRVVRGITFNSKRRKLEKKGEINNWKYDLALQHKNHIFSIKEVLDFKFKDFNIRCKSYPIPMPKNFVDLMLFQIIYIDF